MRRKRLLELLVPSSLPRLRPRVGARASLCSALICAARALAGSPALGQASQRRNRLPKGSAVPLIQRFKFEGRRDSLRGAGRARSLERIAATWRSDVVVPVPRHAARVREQGGDPAFELARSTWRAAAASAARIARVLSPLPRYASAPDRTHRPLPARANVRDSFRHPPWAHCGAGACCCSTT